MAVWDSIKKQFIDVIQWTEESENALADRIPMQDMEIQYGAQLTVRESQMAVFVTARAARRARLRGDSDAVESLPRIECVPR